MKEAMLYEKIDGLKVKCFLCSRRCVIPEGKRGICAVRENRQGTLYSLVYGKVIALNNDPIEKKPLFHFLPGSRSLSMATVGCNFMCSHCQNYEISQYTHMYPKLDVPGREMSPKDIVSTAEKMGSMSISYTYTEPTIFFEMAHDTAVLARERGIKNVFVSNGFMTPESAKLASTFLDANNIDLKGDDRFYKEICHAKIDPVKDTIKIMKAEGVWLEVTTLIIPGHNDTDEMLKETAGFIAGIDPAIPWHVTAFHPTYKLLESPPTPQETLEKARRIGMAEGLKFVYEGNIPGSGGENTICPSCGKTVIGREGYSIVRNEIVAGKCGFCGGLIEGVWS